MFCGRYECFWIWKITSGTLLLPCTRQHGGGILALLDFNICFAGYLGDFAFWVDKPPDNPVVQDLISVVLKSKDFFDSAGLPDFQVRPYCGLVAVKKGAVQVATLLARADIRAGINQIVSATRAKDMAAEARLRGMLPLFRSWCDYRAAQLRRR